MREKREREGLQIGVGGDGDKTGRNRHSLIEEATSRGVEKAPGSPGLSEGQLRP